MTSRNFVIISITVLIEKLANFSLNSLSQLN